MLLKLHNPDLCVIRFWRTGLACVVMATLGWASVADAQPRPDREPATQPRGQNDSDRPRRPDGPATQPRPHRDGDDAGKRPDRPDWSGRSDRDRWSDEELETAGEVLAVIKPTIAERFEKLRDSDPKEAAALLNRHFPQVRVLIRLKHGDPVMFDLRIQEIKSARDAMRLAQAHVKADGEPAKEEVAKQLRQSLAALIDVRNDIRKHELTLLEARIDEMREQITEDAKNRDSILQQKFDRITRWAARHADHGSDDD